MRVPLLDLSEQYAALAEPIRTQIDEVLATQNFILGPKVEAFEEAIAGYCGSPQAIGVSSGTDALLAVFMALGFGPGDAVLTSDYSFFATGRLRRASRRHPGVHRYRPRHLQYIAERARGYLRESCRRDDDGALRGPNGETLRAIVPVHLYGLCCEMEAICKIGEEFRAADNRGRGPGAGSGVSVPGSKRKGRNDGRGRHL